LRIFVFGESAAEGDPRAGFRPFARILQVLLRERYPDRNIEIINTAVTRPSTRMLSGPSLMNVPDTLATSGSSTWVITK